MASSSSSSSSLTSTTTTTSSSSTTPTPTTTSHAMREISKCTVKPQRIVEEAKEPWHLNHSDLTMLKGTYIQRGLLFSKPNEEETISSMASIIETLKDALSRTLVHFYPLTGRLITHHNNDDGTTTTTNPPPASSYYIYIDCSTHHSDTNGGGGGGVEFVHVIVDNITVDDILMPVYVPEIVRSFFLYNGVVNHDGHELPLLGVQVNELKDGYFIGCSFNHCVGDGTSFWHFLNSWSELSRTGGSMISNPPVLKKWFLEGHGPIINLPYSSHQDLVNRITTPIQLVSERVFHFSSECLAKLKAKANQDCGDDDDDNKNKQISSFQSLCALIWKSVIKVRRVPTDQTTMFIITIGDRERLDPPLSKYYLGNSVGAVMPRLQVDELLSFELGKVAMACNQAIKSYNNEVIRKKAENWVKSPNIRSMGQVTHPTLLTIGMSRFDEFVNDFGWGKPLAMRAGNQTKRDGRISARPSRKGKGSLDVEFCLLPETMAALELDEEFMSYASPWRLFTSEGVST